MAINLLVCAPLFAIPSPDVVIGIFASVGQVLGLLAVSIGGILFARKRRRDHLESGTGIVTTGVSPWIGKTLLALLVVSVTANVLQYCRSVDKKNTRLGRNIQRQPVKAGSKDNKDNKLGLSTKELDAMIRSSRPFLMDVREPAEFEMGHIEGVEQIRYPDLKNNPGQHPGKDKLTVLLCHTGNRSSELCDKLTGLGYDCRFLIGGYEKWISEKYPMLYPNGKAVEDLRGLPDFSNKRTLLDTPEVYELISENKAVFVDVRLEEDIAKFGPPPLPSAINFPIRWMPSEDLEAALKTRI